MTQVTLGVGLADQRLPNPGHPELAPAVPREAHDRLLDVVVFPAGVVER